MTRWLVSFDTTVTVSVEAETAREAVVAAMKTINALGIDELRSMLCRQGIHIENIHIQKRADRRGDSPVESDPTPH